MIKKNSVMGGACGKQDVHTGFLWGKSEGKRPLGRSWHRWEDTEKRS
jgi:hypothetical protein